jgi:hypothetical protein
MSAPDGLKSTVRTGFLWSNVVNSSPVVLFQNLALESALPVAARVADELSFADHTAPVWPSKVPIQSPEIPSRSIGRLSWQAEINEVPSCKKKEVIER